MCFQTYFPEIFSLPAQNFTHTFALKKQMKKLVEKLLEFLLKNEGKFSKKELLCLAAKRSKKYSYKEIWFALNYLRHNEYLVIDEAEKLHVSATGKRFLEDLKFLPEKNFDESEVYIFYYDVELFKELSALKEKEGISRISHEELERIAREKPQNFQALLEISNVFAGVPSFAERVLKIVAAYKIKAKYEYARDFPMNYRLEIVLREIKAGNDLVTLHKKLNIHPEVLARYIEILLLRGLVKPEELPDFQENYERFKKILLYFYRSKDFDIQRACKVLKEPLDIIRIGRAWYFVLQLKSHRTLFPHRGNLVLLSSDNFTP